MKTINLYTIYELKEKFPEGFQTAYKKYLEDVEYTPYYQIAWWDETKDSMFKVIESFGLNVDDYSLDGDGYSSWLDISGWGNYEYEISGDKAFGFIKWILEIKSIEKQETEHGHYYNIILNNGKDGNCMFTGYCGDDNFLFSILDSIENGDTLGGAIEKLPSVFDEIIREELEYMKTEEYFMEEHSVMENYYTETGEKTKW